MLPDYQASALFTANYDADTHIIVNQGGSSAGKTHAILLSLLLIACENAGLVITVVGQDMPNLKVGAIRTTLEIQSASEQVTAYVKSYNKTNQIIEFINGTIVEFKSYADAQDAKSGKRDYLFINEANGISWEIYSELALRTRKRIYIDYNPNSTFWVHDKLIGKPGVRLIISDHRHNPFAEQLMRDKIESLKDEDIELWKVYARGLTGKIKGVVFKNWHICEAIPPAAKFIAVGLDFGFSNDETGCIAVYKQNGELWIEELIFKKGLTNPDIGKKLARAGVKKQQEIIADSAEPKSIEELRQLGWYVTPAKKGADSIKNSIDILKRYKLNVTRSSVNLRNDLARYKWRIDKSGEALNEPVDRWNNLIDPLRYIALNKLKINNLVRPKARFPFNEPNRQKSLLGLI
jgi:phage terminase large subunit